MLVNRVKMIRLRSSITKPSFPTASTKNPSRIYKIVYQPNSVIATRTFTSSFPYYGTIKETELQPGQNLIEKIVQNYLNEPNDNEKIRSGMFVTIKPHHILTHDNTGAVITKFKSIGLDKIKDPKQPVFALDHDVQNKSEANLAKYTKIEKFGAEQGVDFYGAGRGIGHQIMLEQGYCLPNTLTVASDSHSNMYGGIGSLGTPLVRTDAAAIWATGKTWWQVPEIVKLNLVGELKDGVVGKDVIITLCHLFSKGEVLNCVIEVGGKGMGKLEVDDRLAISNMSTEWGALAMVFPSDKVTQQWYHKRLEQLGPNHPRINKEMINKLNNNPITSDKDAHYSKTITLDLTTITPYASGPNSVTLATPVLDLQNKNIKINKAYLVSCTNSRASDLNQAATILRGKKVAPGVEFYIAAASKEVQDHAQIKGDWDSLLNSGAIPLPPGCGPCVGLGVGLLKDGEVGISASNRNFKGRMGSRTALAYLASPELQIAVVAASALKGIISLPTTYSSSPATPTATITTHSLPKPTSGSAKATASDLISSFPPSIQGPILYCGNTDNLNTDGIYGGVHTYNDNMTREGMREVVMENYDPEFRNIMREGDILIAGYNFGTGSSREQAATCLLATNIQAVIAATFSQTYKRNAINNGLLVIESIPLIQFLRANTSTDQLTTRSDYHIKLDFVANEIVLSGKDGNEVKRFQMAARIGTDIQKLFVLGGLERWVRAELNL